MRLPLQALRDVAVDDPLREPLDDGGLADARLADEDRVVLRTAGQDLHDAADLGVAADDRVELAAAGPLGEVDAVLLQRLVGALGVLVGHPADAAAHLGERVEQRLGQRLLAAQQRRDVTAGVGEARPAGARSRRTRRRPPWPWSARPRATRAARATAAGRRRSSRDAAGRLRSSASARARTVVGSAPTADSSEAAMPSGWSSSASSRCTGRDLGVPLRRGPAHRRRDGLLALGRQPVLVHGRPLRVASLPAATPTALSLFRSTQGYRHRPGHVVAAGRTQVRQRPRVPAGAT